MADIFDALRVAASLLLNLDETLGGIIVLSLAVSLSAVTVGGIVGMPAGAALAVFRFPGRTVVVVIANALLGFPPVVVGLLVYILLSRAGPLGSFGILFTPSAMVIAQAILVTPIIIALVHRATEALWGEYGDALQSDGANRARAILTLLAIGRAQLVTAMLTSFGRAIAEVGAIIIVGGNIAGVTRTMTTTIALETARGDLPLALGLGIVLLSVSLAVTSATFLMGRRFVVIG
jgi:tungstate transport system permease protein